MKIYKFRALNKKNYAKVKDIINKGFYCSKFSELNDPMEGVFEFAETEKSANSLFDEKQEYKICCFSGINGLKNPLLWGYYANGFRGIAIEVEIYPENLKKIHQVSYKSKCICIDETLTTVDILTRKSIIWKHEDEFRFIAKLGLGVNHYKVGEITKVYFGNPYENVVNRNDLYEKSDSLKEYEEQKEELKTELEKKKIEYENFFLQEKDY